jgi:DNA-binding transcriptional MerR regulator
MEYLSTSQVAREAGVHPNTVRRYAEWGLIPPVERTPSGYRRFTQRHLDCMRLARLIYLSAYPGRGLRQSSLRVIQAAVTEGWEAARQEAVRHLALVQAERRQAEVAADLLEHWAQEDAQESGGPALRIGEAARALDVTIDMLRNWERNGLIDVPRNPHNGYRRYGPKEISRLRVIRMLGKAGYSMMAMLRMFLQLDRGETRDLRRALDTPRADEDIYSAADHWLSTLEEQEDLARRAAALLEEILARPATP